MSGDGAGEAADSLARFQTKDKEGLRGGCKICGGLGHMTKQCRNRADILQASEPTCFSDVRVEMFLAAPTRFRIEPALSFSDSFLHSGASSMAWISCFATYI